MQTVIWQKNLRLRIDPNAVRDFVLDLSAWLEGETISTATTTATGITVVSTTHNTTTVTVRVSAATVGASIRVHVVTSTGQEDDWTIGFDVQEK